MIYIIYGSVRLDAESHDDALEVYARQILRVVREDASLEDVPDVLSADLRVMAVEPSEVKEERHA